MAVTKIRGNTQIIDGSILNAQISASAAIATSKLADGAEFLLRNGSVALTGNLNANSNRIVGLAAPVDANDAARKADIDFAVMGLDIKQSVRVATTANIDLATELENGDSIDGVTLATGDRVLVKNQTDAEDNGIYVVPASGAASRASDADSNDEVNPNMFLFVEEGTAHADTGWVLVTNAPITLGTTELAFTQFSGVGSGGTINNGSNVGAGVGVFHDVSGDTLRFRSLVSNNSRLSITLDSNEIDFEIPEFVNADISASAAIARSKLASGSANHVLINDGSGVMSSEAVLAVSRGGTNSSAALNNNRVMVSSGSAIVEAAAITASRALVSDSNGLPVASSVTSTELGYVSGVTSSIQDQLDAKLTNVLTSAQIFVGNGSNVATAVALSGDATISNAGVLTLASDVVKEADFVDREIPAGDVDGVNDAYVLDFAPIAGSEHVYLNGLLQDVGAGNDYTISGDTITFEAPPLSGDKIRVSYRK